MKEASSNKTQRVKVTQYDPPYQLSTNSKLMGLSLSTPVWFYFKFALTEELLVVFRLLLRELVVLAAVLGTVVDGVDVALVQLKPGVVSQVPINRMELLNPPGLGTDLLKAQQNNLLYWVSLISNAFANGKTIFVLLCGASSEYMIISGCSDYFQRNQIMS